MINYVIKKNDMITVEQFEIVDNCSVGLTTDMFLNKDEIVYDIVTNRLNDNEKIYFKNISEDNLIMEHLGFGMWIRNTYGLWEVSINPLVEKNSQPDSIKHPDNCSYEIMKLVTRTLREEYTPNITLPEENFNNAMKIIEKK